MSNRRRPDGSPPPEPDGAGPARAGAGRTGPHSTGPSRAGRNGSGPGRGRPRRQAAAGRRGQRSSQRGAALLIRLQALPPFVVPAVVFVLLLLGLLGPAWVAVPSLVLIAGLLLWLGMLSWPHVGARGKVVRAMLLGFIVAAIASRIYALVT